MTSINANLIQANPPYVAKPTVLLHGVNNGAAIMATLKPGTISRPDAEFVIRIQGMAGSRSKFEALYAQLYRKYARIKGDGAYVESTKATRSVSWFIKQGIIAAV